MIKDLVLNTKFWAIAAIVSFSLIALLGIAGNILASRFKADAALYQKLGVFFLTSMGFLVFVLAISLWPIAVNMILSFQVAIGNADVPFIAFFLHHRVALVLAMWGLMSFGMLIVLIFKPWKNLFS